MTIQISVVIWTVICFILLMLILNNLLFKPMLDMMDKRRHRIEKAKSKKAEYEAACAEHEALVAQKALEHEAQHKKLIKERVEKIRSDQKKAVEAAKEVRLHQLDSFRKKTDEEEAEIMANLGAHAEELALKLAQSIIKG